MTRQELSPERERGGWVSGKGGRGEETGTVALQERAAASGLLWAEASPQQSGCSLRHQPLALGEPPGFYSDPPPAFVQSGLFFLGGKGERNTGAKAAQRPGAFPGSSRPAVSLSWRNSVTSVLSNDHHLMNSSPVRTPWNSLSGGLIDRYRTVCAGECYTLCV